MEDVSVRAGTLLKQPQVLMFSWPSNETRISCSLWRPQTRKIDSASRGRHGLTASCAG